MSENTESVAISDVAEEVVESRPLTPREEAMEAIASSRTAKIEEETGVSLTDKPEEPVIDQVTEQLAEPEPAPVPEVQKVKVKVDGVEQEVDVDTLVRTYQKNSAADRRLEEATRLLREAEERAAAQAANPGKTQGVGEQTPDDLRQEAAQIIDKMYDGDKDAAADALIHLLAKAKGGDQPTQAPVELDEGAITDRVLARMAVNTAFETIKSDYPDIISDPDLEVLTAMKIDRAVAQGTPRAQAMLDAAAEVYKTLGKEPAGRQKAVQPSSRQDNKARLDNIPAASATATPSEPPQENPSPSSVIAEMARKRLGQSLAL